MNDPNQYSHKLFRIFYCLYQHTSGNYRDGIPHHLHALECEYFIK